MDKKQIQQIIKEEYVNVMLEKVIDITPEQMEKLHGDGSVEVGEDTLTYDEPENPTPTDEVNENAKYEKILNKAKPKEGDQIYRPAAHGLGGNKNYIYVSGIGDNMHKFTPDKLAAWFKKFNAKELKRKGVSDLKDFANYIITKHSMKESVNEAKTFKKGDKVKYLDQPGVITNVEDKGGRTFYSVKYKGSGGTKKAKGILSTDGTITEATGAEMLLAPKLKKFKEIEIDGEFYERHRGKWHGPSRGEIYKDSEFAQILNKALMSKQKVKVHEGKLTEANLKFTFDKDNLGDQVRAQIDIAKRNPKKTAEQFIQDLIAAIKSRKTAFKWDSWHPNTKYQYLKAVDKFFRVQGIKVPKFTDMAYDKIKSVLGEGKLNEISTKAGLADVIKGRTSAIEGIKMSKELAQGIANWISTSPYGRRYGKQILKGRIHSLLGPANAMGIADRLGGKLKAEWKALYAKHGPKREGKDPFVPTYGKGDVVHDCPKHVKEIKSGKEGKVVGHTLNESGDVNFVDVDFGTGKIYENIPTKKLKILEMQEHRHEIKEEPVQEGLKGNLSKAYNDLASVTQLMMKNLEKYKAAKDDKEKDKYKKVAAELTKRKHAANDKVEKLIRQLDKDVELVIEAKLPKRSLEEGINPNKVAELLFQKLAHARLIGKQNRRSAVNVIQKTLSKMNLSEAEMDRKFAKEFQSSVKALLNHLKHELGKGPKGQTRAQLQLYVKQLTKAIEIPGKMAKLLGSN